MDFLKRASWMALVLLVFAGCSANGGFSGSSGGGGGGGGGGGPVSTSDSDNDGVPDRRDQCPGTEPGASVDDVGCAENQTPSASDSDGDGIIDSHDQCSGTPEDAEANEAGCAADQTPDNPDADGDGVVDDSDQCPNTAPGDEADENGCAEGQEPVSEPLLLDLGVDGGLISEIADFSCTATPAGVGEEITSGTACDLGDTLGLTLCQTLNPEAAADGVGDGSTSALVQLVTSLLDLQPLPTGELIARAGVQASEIGTIPENNVAGFFVEFPTDVADANVLQSLVVTTFLDGAEQESRDLLQPLGLGLAGAKLIGGTPVLVGFENTLPYDAVEIIFGGTVEAEAVDAGSVSPDPNAVIGDVADVWNVCTAAEPPAAR